MNDTCYISRQQSIQRHYYTVNRRMNHKISERYNSFNFYLNLFTSKIILV